MVERRAGRREGNMSYCLHPQLAESSNLPLVSDKWMAMITLLRLTGRKSTSKSYPGLDLLRPGCREVYSNMSISATLQNSRTDRQRSQQQQED